MIEFRMLLSFDRLDHETDNIPRVWLATAVVLELRSGVDTEEMRNSNQRL